MRCPISFNSGLLRSRDVGVLRLGIKSNLSQLPMVIPTVEGLLSSTQVYIRGSYSRIY